MSCKTPATCPSWWDCLTRGCYELAKARYTHSRHTTPSRYQDERSTDGRSIYLDHHGYYKRRDEII